MTRDNPPAPCDPNGGAKPVALSYQSPDPQAPSGARPRWVYALVGLYLLILLMLLTAPAWSEAVTGEHSIRLFITAVVGCMVVCGLSLMILPVPQFRRRAVTKRTIWFPVIGSGLLAAMLVCGAGYALIELILGEKDVSMGAYWALYVAAVLVWGAWSVLFLMMGYRDGPQSIGMKLHRRLIAGSVLELLVAVPSHVIVRRREECCAGMLTGFGICIGVAVMIVSLGPSVLILYYRRRKQITPQRRAAIVPQAE